MPFLTDPMPTLNLLVDALRDVAIEADVDPAKVNPPAVWVKWIGYDQAVLSGGEYLRVEAFCTVGANAYPDAIAALVDLGDRVADVLGFPDGPVRHQATLFASNPTPLPTLVLPYLVEPVEPTP